VDRRRFLTRVGLGVLGLGLGAGALAAGDVVAGGLQPTPHPRGIGAPRPHPHPVPVAAQLPPYFEPPHLTKVALPGATLYGLPGPGTCNWAITR